ncbi:MAG TPA: hypothetical protein VFJ94_07040 [Intrasporangium sp.]|uniref:hypothetical protein n=1 Tax=Intrasporangium sp. TaxID=1925024 RepID=UPI002D781ADC|nr:hypothetical protein [Intrasporangium sp.]HET7398261.1 hypothetical protein [Intrasporangium sp.]
MTQTGARPVLDDAPAGASVAPGQAGNALASRVDRLAALAPPAFLVLALVTFVALLLTGHDVARWLAVPVAVLVVTSPHLLELARPAARLLDTGRQARVGLLVRRATSLERSRHVDTPVLDASPVTTGRLRLRSIAVVGRLSKAAALQAAAAVEQGSEDPVARAIVEGARLARLQLPPTTDFTTHPGEGATARIKGTQVTVGQAALFDDVDQSLREHARRSGGTTVFVGWDGVAKAALTVEAEVRTSSPAPSSGCADSGSRPGR